MEKEYSKNKELFNHLNSCCEIVDENFLKDLEEGIRKTKLLIASRMKYDKLNIQLISKYTGLSIDKINTL